MSEWILEYDGFDPEQERLREALCTLGNGYFATRGAAAEATASTVHYPATYLAGGFNRLITDIAGRPIVNEDLVNFPNWLHLTFKPEGGEWFNLLAVEILSYRQELHLKNGLLNRDIRFRDKQGNIFTLSTRRLVHMADPHLAAMETAISSENWSGKMRIKSELDGSVINAGVDRYKQLNSKHLETLNLGKAGDDSVYLVVRTVQSRIEMAQAARTRMFLNGKRMTPEIHSYEEKEVVGQELEFDLAKGKTFKVEKIVSLYTCRDAAISECSLAAQEAVSRAGRFTELLDSHTRAWHSLWRRYDVEVRAKDQAQLVLRLHIFHLLQTISPHTIGLDVGVPARGLHGEAYRGHIFWDEMFMFFFYSLRIPEVTRSLLLYRYRRLDAARAGAKEAGYEGAMYPWQSGSDGSEETQKVHLNPISGRWIDDHSRLQRHVNIAIVYNVWQYYQASGDMEFLVYYGAEMMLEIARFWASIATYNKKTKRYEIKGVMGPDEYHEKYPNSEKGGLNNNAYTNVMAVWVLERAIEVLDLLDEERRSELFEELNLKKEEIQRWKDITCKMTVPFHGDGIISQFEGYDQLEEFDWERYRKKYGNIGRLDRILEAEGDSPDRYKLSKQADVLMLFYLLSIKELQRLFRQLGYRFDKTSFRKNVDYYMERTSHGSTLSRVVHAFVLAHIDPPRFWAFFTEALKSDIADIQGGTTKEGIHLGAMAGIDDLLLGCYAGIETWGDHIAFDPVLPGGMQKLHLRLRYRGRWYELDMVKGRLRVSLGKDGREPVPISVKGKTYKIQPGKSQDFKL
ncbi:MAG: glycoside hydrolase family 65 protein [Deltaproteobacteria bacterium]|nr:glycoside hydrolase family 65 protein [Deltaproteobacteria bacterium]